MNKTAQTNTSLQSECSMLRWVSLVLLSSLAIVAAVFILHDHWVCHKGIKFVNAKVACDEKPMIKKHGYASVQGVLEKYIQAKILDSKAFGISLYFRDLENGPVFGINEFADFAPASLLKLPLALVYFIEAEERPEILEDMLSYSTPSEFTKTFSDGNGIKPDTPYSIEELMKRMLVYSDNNAYELLYNHIEETGREGIIRETYLELGILSPIDAHDKIISVRRYASILRGLYNSSLISVKNSEKVLGWLAESTFDIGLRAGIPQDIVIANKYGERISPDGSKQLHDCGIIYFPSNPYLLCIMTVGSDYKELDEVIVDISRTVYKEVESRKL